LDGRLIRTRPSTCFFQRANRVDQDHKDAIYNSPVPGAPHTTGAMLGQLARWVGWKVN